MADFDRESMLDMFIFEMNQQLELLEQNIIEGETGFTMDRINEIFRVMHTIKGSAAMMLFDSIASTAHAMEDLFYYLREENPSHVDFSGLADHVLEGKDFIKLELQKIEEGVPADGDGSDIIKRIKLFLNDIKNGTTSTGSQSTPAASAAVRSVEKNDTNGLHNYLAKIYFEEGCEMENIRSYTLVHNISDTVSNINHEPQDVIDDQSIEIIRKNGFHITFSSDKTYDEIYEMLSQTIYLRELFLEELTEDAQSPSIQPQPEHDNYKEEYREAVSVAEPMEYDEKHASVQTSAQTKKTSSGQHVISVNVSKLDQLLNLMGELVIAESMVTQNPDLVGLELENFNKEARQLQKIIKDVQDIVMSMRMVPLSTTFFKMHRIVRDMCKQLSKDVQLNILGEETEVDKNIIEHISDPLMHIIRNSVDHGIEMPEERVKNGKSEIGQVTLEAKNSGGDVLIIISDDGAGLNRDKIMAKAKANGLLRKSESDYTDKEIHQFIFLPGFSTNQEVTSFSGRGVGMDVVTANLEFIGGSVLVDSTLGQGTNFTLKIPLTLAIVDGMTIKIGDAKYTIPIASIKNSFKVDNPDQVFSDPDGNEMITVRGEVFNVLRLYRFFNIEANATDVMDGIMIMLENGDQTICAMADDLIGAQSVVLKQMPKYIKKVHGISGCTLLGGEISLIIDVAGLFD